MQFMGKMASSTIPKINFYEQFCDGSLCTEDGSTFKIHRVLLAQTSEYFRALFSFEAYWNSTADIMLKGIQSQTLCQILHYLYEGALQLNEKNVCDLMIAADYMLLDDLTKQCRDFVIRGMTPGNCLPLLTIAARYESLDIFRECSRYAKVHFEEITNSFPEKIGDLPIEILTELLKDNALSVTSEDTVWRAIITWMKVDPVNRKRHLPDLLTFIRFEDADFASKMVKDSTVMFNPFYMKEIPATHLINQLSFLQAKLTKETRLPKYLHAVFSRRISESEIISEMHLTCDEKLDFWRKINDVPSFPDFVVPIGKYIYLFDPWKDVALRYDLLNNSWISLTEMSVRRHSYCIVELNKMIYALGGLIQPDGEDGEEDTDAIERYDPETKVWNPIESAGTMLISDAVAMNGRIYVFGCIDNGPVFDITMVARVYDPTTDIWTTVEPPKVLRYCFSAVAFENHLYLIGGEYIGRVLRSVEEYDPVLDVWSLLPDLPVAYLTPKAVVVAERMMVFNNGVCQEDLGIPVSPAVHWDGGTRTWQNIDRSFEIERYRFGILDDPSVVRDLVCKSRRSFVQWKRNF